MAKRTLGQALWRIYRRNPRPLPWAYGGNLPWEKSDFSERMLREHLDDAHGAASRIAAERQAQVAWLWPKLGLAAGKRLLDVTCGPGLYAVPFAQRGAWVMGVDIAPAAICHAQALAAEQGVEARCHFIQADVQGLGYAPRSYDAAILLYGQLAVMPREAARQVLQAVADGLKRGGRLCVEMLHPDKIDKTDSSWWYTDETGLWGNAPYLHLGERKWYAEEKLSLERYLIVHLDSAVVDEITLCDQSYAPEEMVEMLKEAGFGRVDVYPKWDGLALYDADEWLVYIAQVSG